MGIVDRRFEQFSRAEWAELRSSTPLTLGGSDIDRLRGILEKLDIDEVQEVYLPLSRLLNLYISKTQQLAAVTDTFLGTAPASVPFIIGIGGSVAVGKSTTARVLQSLLSNWSDHPDVGLLTTDGYLYPNAELERRGLMDRKGFPESYDTAALIDTLQAVRSGAAVIETPVYSHLAYDIVEGAVEEIRQPDVLIVEGLNVLQGNPTSSNLFVSDFFDFSIYVDAEEELIKQWYVERFLLFRESVFSNPASYFRHYADLDTDQATEVALDIWERINAPNLAENITPTRTRARCILTKGDSHAVTKVSLQK